MERQQKRMYTYRPLLADDQKSNKYQQYQNKNWQGDLDALTQKYVTNTDEYGFPANSVIYKYLLE